MSHSPQARSKKRSGIYRLSLAIGTGVVPAALCSLQLRLFECASAGGRPARQRRLQAVAFSLATEDRVATAVMGTRLQRIRREADGCGDPDLTFGCANGMLLAGARVYYAMSRDGLFFKSVGKLIEKSKTPVNSLWVQCLWTSLLCLSGSYGQLLDYVIFARVFLLHLDDCRPVHLCGGHDQTPCGPIRHSVILCCRDCIS